MAVVLPALHGVFEVDLDLAAQFVGGGSGAGGVATDADKPSPTGSASTLAFVPGLPIELEELTAGCFKRDEVASGELVHDLFVPDGIDGAIGGREDEGCAFALGIVRDESEAGGCDISIDEAHKVFRAISGVIVVGLPSGSGMARDVVVVEAWDTGEPSGHQHVYARVEYDRLVGPVVG